MLRMRTSCLTEVIRRSEGFIHALMAGVAVLSRFQSNLGMDGSQLDSSKGGGVFVFVFHMHKRMNCQNHSSSGVLFLFLPYLSPVGLFLFVLFFLAGKKG